MEDDLIEAVVIERLTAHLKKILRLEDFKRMYSDLDQTKFKDPSLRPMLLRVVDDHVASHFERLAERAKQPRDINELVNQVKSFSFADPKRATVVTASLESTRANHSAWM